MMATHTQFSGLQKLLHWLMAVLILSMLFVGVGMVFTVSQAHDTLVALHRPLGIALLLLVIVRLAVRLRRGAPPLPDSIPPAQQFVAKASHYVLYGLMLAMPLVGWGMLSAGGYPVTMAGSFHLPPILPASVTLFALLRTLHTWLGLALFAVVLLHLAAALLHALVLRDGVFAAMAPGGGRR
ncbi:MULTISPECIES: cytochrome b/b6 domain-containing protein [unclassified Cupriavidus]|uniref:cytochrome b n=1 Tax=unclassified Cupriavidus TaxID=2640874 RepID=UPI001C004BCE|nr:MULTISPECIES: cytochrome b/b6 domain-containing protein [unclassified Cupriavidus]MCA3183100.1 cytochrome b [Cupriavidus sp.]MCA3189554.1 cytochrome b [Cupriavidus sp.]MCA3195634.1 cytochrome b [Cupriavidus sp.]MCA3201189.1 cytochrome b [Cupriavidus sp.]MCA3209004.1 cytochrome b [Cupriavidus sp.]